MRYIAGVRNNNHRKATMFKLLLRSFRQPTAAEIIEKERANAQREHLAHAGAAEYHAALAQVYKQRVVRLDGLVKGGV